MARFHAHVRVDDIASAVRFYTAVFGNEPTRVHGDYAQWVLSDPNVNFAISTHGAGNGLDHFGLQAEDAEELAAIEARIREAGGPITEEAGTTCCYARSDKYWTLDPVGLPWEAYHRLGDAPTYSGAGAGPAGDSCCAPAAERFVVTEKAACAPGGGCCD